MRVVLTKKMVVGHVMRYPGEVVEVAETGGRGDMETRGRGDMETRGRGDAGTRGHGDTGTETAIVPEAAPPKPPRRSRKP